MQSHKAEPFALRIDRLGITLSLVLLGLALSMLVRLPSRELALDVLGSDLTATFSGTVQLSFIMVAVVCAGVDAIMRSHPRLLDRAFIYTVPLWVLPTIVTVASLVLLEVLPWWGYQILLIGATGSALAVIVVAQFHTLDADDQGYQTARLILNAGTYVCALLLFLALYGSRARSVLSATGILLGSGMLSLELLRNTDVSLWRTWLYASLIGLIMGQLTWAMNYTSFDARVAGALLLLSFYTLSGLAQQYLWGRLTRRVAIEYSALYLLGVAAIVWLDGWLL